MPRRDSASRAAVERGALEVAAGDGAEARGRRRTSALRRSPSSPSRRSRSSRRSALIRRMRRCRAAALPAELRMQRVPVRLDRPARSASARRPARRSPRSLTSARATMTSSRRSRPCARSASASASTAAQSTGTGVCETGLLRSSRTMSTPRLHQPLERVRSRGRRAGLGPTGCRRRSGSAKAQDRARRISPARHANNPACIGTNAADSRKFAADGRAAPASSARIR